MTVLSLKISNAEEPEDKDDNLVESESESKEDVKPQAELDTKSEGEGKERQSMHGVAYLA